MTNKKITILLLIILGIVVLIAGIYAGILLEKQITGPKLEKAQNAIKTLSSKVIPSIIASGEVSKISGRNITLTQAGESLEIKIREDARIFSSGATLEEPGNVPKEISLEEIKISDFLNVMIKISPDAGIEGFLLSVFPKIEMETP